MVAAVFALCHEYARDGAAFDLRRWHAAALDVGPIGLGLLPSALREAGAARVAG